MFLEWISNWALYKFTSNFLSRYRIKFLALRWHRICLLATSNLKIKLLNNSKKILIWEKFYYYSSDWAMQEISILFKKTSVIMKILSVKKQPKTNFNKNCSKWPLPFSEHKICSVEKKWLVRWSNHSDFHFITQIHESWLLATLSDREDVNFCGICRGQKLFTVKSGLLGDRWIGPSRPIYRSFGLLSQTRYRI